MRDDSTLNVQDYLDNSSHASTRTRTVAISIVVACVLVFAGLLNSLQTQWMLERIRSPLANMNSPYTRNKIGDPPTRDTFPDETSFEQAMKMHQERYLAFYGACARVYAETSLVVRVPFFGFTIDANDLSVVGGFSFVILLVLFRFCLSREVDNLRLSFAEADRLGQLREFYNLLAMSQVFTVPRTPDLKRTKFLQIVPKVIGWLPIIVLGAVVGHDFLTAYIGKEMSQLHTRISLGSGLLLLGAVSGLTQMVTVRMVRLDGEWDKCWARLARRATQETTLTGAGGSKPAVESGEGSSL